MSWLKRLFGKTSPAPIGDAMSPEFAALVEASRAHVAALTQAHQGGWRFDQHQRWNLSQETGVLRFSFEDGIVAECPAQAAGSFSESANTWLWAWNNPSVDPALKRDVEKVRAYGQEHGIAHLTVPEWQGDLNDAWSMTAVAVRLCDAQGAFCARVGPMVVFLMFGEVRLSKPEQA
jgi:hypothetical protein